MNRYYCSICGNEMLFCFNRYGNKCVCNSCMKIAGLNHLFSKVPFSFEDVEKLVLNKKSFVPTNIGKLLSLDNVHKLICFNERAYNWGDIDFCSLVLAGKEIRLCGQALDGCVFFTEDELLVLLNKYYYYLNEIEIRLKIINEHECLFNFYKTKSNKEKYVRLIINEIMSDFGLLELMRGKKIISKNNENITDNFEILSNLKKLFTDGVLTESEYIKLKQKYIDKL